MEKKTSVFEVYVIDSDQEINASKEEKTTTVTKSCDSEGLRGLLPHGAEKQFEENSLPPIIKLCLVEHDYFKMKFDCLGNTLPFGNANSEEQQTIDFECLLPRVNPKNLIDLYKKTKVEKRKNNPVSSNNNSTNSNDDGNNRKDNLEDELDGRYNSTGSDDSDSVDSSESVKDSWKENVKGQDDGFVSIHDLASKIRAMQKITKLKCVDGENAPKLKTLLKSDNFSSIPEYIFPLPNLTKMVNGENWNIKYIDNEIQNLGLDDLLLKASELNAENFTKALGRKSDSSKGNVIRKDNPEIVFRIPKSGRNSEGTENDDATRENNVKTVKLDICKHFYDKTKGTETKPDSPKRSCIKVKTVENINEEFEGSLGRLNGVDKSIGVDKPEKTEEQKTGEGEPFVMTIIQSKRDKKAPAILRNSYLKRRASSEKLKAAEKKSEDLESEKKEEANSKVQENVMDAKNESQKAQEDDKSKSGTGTEMVNPNQKLQQMANGKSKPVKINEGKEKSMEKIFKITSTEQKLGPKETNQRFIKIVPYEPANKSAHSGKSPQLQQKASDDESDCEKNSLSFTALSTILKDVLPDEWVLSLDKKFGLQIMRTHLDDLLNPSILMSIVIARSGKLVVNICGRQLKQSHELFLNNGEMRNTENKLSLSYVLGILDKLRRRTVCLGCDDPSLKKYWCDEGSIEYQTEFQQVYRSRFCGLLISLGRKRCYPCYRLNESLKKRLRRDKLGEKKEVAKEQVSGATPKRGVKRNLEDFLEESFSTMRQQIVDEIEKNKKLGEKENALKAQEEVLSFMGLARKESLHNSVRKSKRKKNSFFKLEQPAKKKIDQQELEFLEKYWTDINTLFSTSLLFGAYSRTGTNRLREKCKMFQKLLSTWKNIMSSNPEWIGGEVNLPEELTDNEENENLQEKASSEQFDKMDVPALRAYIINSVKEVNKIKHKLRTRNSYFKVLYNKFVKRRMKKPKMSGANSNGARSSETSATNTPTPTDFSSDENSREKPGEEGETKPGNESLSAGEEGE